MNALSKLRPSGPKASLLPLDFKPLLLKLLHYFPLTTPRGILGLLGALLLLLNVKSLPLVWHFRFYSALYHHLFKHRTSYPTPSHLFAPISTISRPTLRECDVNMHKSNSSYFSDLDINRSHLIAHLIKKSLQIQKKQGQRPMYVALAGVTALFRREIKPFEKYEMRSRVLAWDGKWLFVVSHFLKTGKQKQGEDPQKRIFASCLSKYVFKAGRKTIPPDEVLTLSGLIPPRPEGVPAPLYPEASSGSSSSNTPHGSMTPIPSLQPSAAVPVPAPVQSQENAAAASTLGDSTYDMVVDRVLEKSLECNADEGAGWTYGRIERERRKGMEICKAFLGLDGLDGEVREVEQWGRLW